MNKLDKLEKALKEYREALEKQMQSFNAEAIDVNKKEHKDEKEDKKMIQEALDEHNEKKHDEPKNENSAMKSDCNELVKFDENGQWSIAKAEDAKAHGSAKHLIDKHYGGSNKSGAGASPAGKVKEIDPKSGKIIREIDPFKKK